MTRLVRILAALAVLAVVGATPALAWQCPTQWRAAEEAIKNAEATSIPPEAKPLLDDARRFVAEAKKHHSEGTTKVEHARSMWKAKAAIAIAESVITISRP